MAFLFYWMYITISFLVTFFQIIRLLWLVKLVIIKQVNSRFFSGSRIETASDKKVDNIINLFPFIKFKLDRLFKFHSLPLEFLVSFNIFR